MNQFFSFKRFTLLVLKHWADNKKRYGLAILALIGLLTIRFLFHILIADDNDSFNDVQPTTFFFSLFVVGTFYASQYFRDLGSKAKAGNFLSVPASTFEKLLCSLVYSVLLFTAVFTAAFYLVNILMLALSNEIFAEDRMQKSGIINVFKIGFFILREDLRINGLLFFMAIQSVFLFGSVYFKRYSFLKTIISGFIIYFFLFGLTYIFCRPLFPGDSTEARLPQWIEQAFGILVMYVIAPLLWTLTYYRLKRKQV